MPKLGFSCMSGNAFGADFGGNATNGFAFSLLSVYATRNRFHTDNDERMPRAVPIVGACGSLGISEMV